MQIGTWTVRRLPPPATASDVVLAAALFLVAQVDIWAPGLAVWGDDPVAGPRLWNALAFLVITGAVAWRRSAPLPAVVVAMVAISLQAVISQDSPIGLLLAGPVLALVYSVGCYGGRRAAWTGLAVTAVAAGIHDLLDADIRTARDVGDASYWWLVTATAWLAGRYVGSRRRSREAAERARRREAELAHAQREAVTAERMRIANELHDVVAHSVSVIALQAGAALEQLDRSPERARTSLLDIETSARNALGEMGALVGLLRTTDDDQTADVQRALSDLPRLVEGARAAGLQVEVRTTGSPRRLSPGLELSAFRVLQEAVTNSLKHAGPGTRATVAVDYGPDELRISVRDDGRGESTRVVGGVGHGLLGMRERVSVYGGELRAGPLPSGGFQVDVRIPTGGLPT